MKNDKSQLIPKHLTTIGGEALIEGVMMRGPEEIAIAIRKPDGEIYIEKKPLETLAKKNKFFKLPVIRGSVGIIESMIIGIKALMFSAEFFELEEEKPSKLDTFIEKLFGDKLQDVIIYFSVFMALVFGIGLFMVLPFVFANLIGFQKSTTSGMILYNVFEGVVRIVLFFFYIYLISKMKDIKRVFQYHGAEHKAIHCYESQEELTVDNVRKYTTRHPRCGTSFLFIVMLVSIVVFSFIQSNNYIINIASRLLLIPLIAGISYEFIRLAGKSKSKIMKLVSLPGLGLQYFTTNEPDDSQIEVAIAALKGVLVEDKNADKW